MTARLYVIMDKVGISIEYVLVPVY